MSTTSHTVSLALDTLLPITTFGEGQDGALYVAEIMDGTVYELKDAASPPAVSLARTGGAAQARSRAIAEGWSDGRSIGVASGMAFPDGLAGAALLGAYAASCS
ncbi:hypothetical protein MX659_02045 [Coriobacteriia bacterium Es71-Z0120]|uniref:hypothetical protein n=1 Tax=Parvivirga hydrogeniphila TaxID=2939460 RepID=UPI002260B491|nr:hypothetical protein [Parvivirga hydrogeniphila]MCL4078389.1 hypothetical protein [Parvivirga hydrogeniphila]